jgi:prepilin-type N-terminal cleavage/methylation domain-containing protein
MEEASNRVAAFFYLDSMKRAFTLIELLVVIAIIAILAAILFPVFAQAKEAAKKSSDLSNTKQMGTALAIYMADVDDVYPSAYYYNNDNNSANGYTHWSGMIMPYVKNLQIFVSPGDATGGMAPTNFINNNGGAGAPAGQVTQNAVQDNQAPRLSYTANATVLPRKRRTADPAQIVNGTAIDNVANLIVFAPLTEVPSCINDASAASGVSFKSHRSTNAFALDAAGTPFAGEAATEIGRAQYFAITLAQARTALVTCRASSALGQLHIAYTQPGRFNRSSTNPVEGTANYLYADTHAKNAKLGATLSTNSYQWGTRLYSAGGGAIVDALGNPVR